MAAESDAEYLAEDVLPDGLRMIPLPGNFFDIVGFRTSDDVVYLADCLSSRETMEKYGVTFIYDVSVYLETYSMVRNMDAKMFVPLHAEATEDIKAFAEYNISKGDEVAVRVLDACSDSASSDEIIGRIFRSYGLTMNMQQYVLVVSTGISYLSWLKDSGQIDVIADDGMILWRKIRWRFKTKEMQ